MAKTTSNTSKSGLRSPMCGYEQNYKSMKTPAIAGNTMIQGSAPKHPAPLQSPMPAKNPKRGTGMKWNRAGEVDRGPYA